MVFPYGEALLSRGQVSSLPLNVRMQAHVLSQDLSQGMPVWGGGGGGTQFVHGRSCMTIDPRIPTMPGRSTLVFTNQADIACAKREAP